MATPNHDTVFRSFLPVGRSRRLERLANLQLTELSDRFGHYMCREGLHRTRGGMQWWPRLVLFISGPGQICRA